MRRDSATGAGPEFLDLPQRGPGRSRGHCAARRGRGGAFVLWRRPPRELSLGQGGRVAGPGGAGHQFPAAVGRGDGPGDRAHRADPGRDVRVSR